MHDKWPLVGRALEELRQSLSALRRFRQTGLALKKSHPSRRIFRKLTIGVEMMILHLVLRRPGIYLHEIARELEETLGAEIALSTINFVCF